MQQVLAVAVGGALGCLCRYGANLACVRWFEAPVFYSTLAVNVVGAFLIGLIAGLPFMQHPLLATGAVVGFLFIVVNGHLLVIAALVKSFDAFAVGDAPFAFVAQARPHEWGAMIFATGLWIALPLVGMLLFVNLVVDGKVVHAGGVPQRDRIEAWLA